MQLVFTRSEVDGAETFCRYLTVGGHGKGRYHEWPLKLAPHDKENA
jgi:hypothetical protein